MEHDALSITPSFIQSVTVMQTQGIPTWKCGGAPWNTSQVREGMELLRKRLTAYMLVYLPLSTNVRTSRHLLDNRVEAKVRYTGQDIQKGQGAIGIFALVVTVPSAMMNLKSFTSWIAAKE